MCNNVSMLPYGRVSGTLFVDLLFTLPYVRASGTNRKTQKDTHLCIQFQIFSIDPYILPEMFLYDDVLLDSY